MSDSYQAVFDAVRSKFPSCNPGEVIERVVRDAFDVSHARAMLQDEIARVGYELTRPCVVFKPRVVASGNRWCVMYGTTRPDAVCGYGDTVELAMMNFDANWRKERPAVGGQALVKT